MQELLDVFKELQGGLHRLQDAHRGLQSLRGLRQLHLELQIWGAEVFWKN